MKNLKTLLITLSLVSSLAAQAGPLSSALQVTSGIFLLDSTSEHASLKDTMSAQVVGTISDTLANTIADAIKMYSITTRNVIDMISSKKTTDNLKGAIDQIKATEDLHDLSDEEVAMLILEVSEM